MVMIVLNLKLMMKKNLKKLIACYKLQLKKQFPNMHQRLKIRKKRWSKIVTMILVPKLSMAAV